MPSLCICRRFSVQRCARCHLGISASEMVMRARDLVYHLNCFTCNTCNKMLTTGDHFGMKDNLVYCRLHFETLIQGEYQVHFNHSDVTSGKGSGLGSGASSLGLPYYNGVGTVQKGRPRKRKSPGPGADLAAYNAGKRKQRSHLFLMLCFPLDYTKQLPFIKSQLIIIAWLGIIICIECCQAGNCRRQDLSISSLQVEMQWMAIRWKGSGFFKELNGSELSEL